jgi:hypothetical protein
MIMLTRLRKRRQSGHEILEFALVALLYVPTLLGTFITGMNMIRSIQANHIARDLDDMYIHGADFSTYAMQVIAQRLATGLDLQIGSSFTGNNNSNTGNGGRGLVWMTQVMWIGNTTDPTCQAVLPAACTNANSFVFTQRIRFGNGTLTSERPSSLGDPTATLSSAGVVQNAVTDAGARLPAAAQTAMQALWQSGSNGTVPLQDGQAMYVSEVYFKSPDLNVSALSGAGVYARWFY